MILGVLIGLLISTWRGVALASLAAVPVGLAVYHFLQRPALMAEGLPGDALSYAIAGGYSLVTTIAVASVVYGVKRLIVRRRATETASH